MTNEILSEFPELLKQIEQCEKAAFLLRTAADNVIQRGSEVDANTYRGAAVLALTAAQEMAITAGRLEQLESMVRS